MKYSKWLGIIAVVLLVIAAIQPWVYIPSRNISITGLQTAGTNFGKPALMNLIISGIAAALFLLPSLLAKRANVFVCTLNVAWAIRNFILLSICRAGECPEKKTGIYLLVIASLLMLVATLFPDVEITEDED